MIKDSINYVSVTELTGASVTSEQLQRMYTRYRFASEFCDKKDVLEVACGSGQGLGYLARVANTVVGGDYDEKILQYAKNYYGNKVEIKKIDAQQLPMEDNSFDVIILYEAIYYLSDPEAFVKEARRVLRHNGIVLIATANKDWSGFNPSPFSKKYFSAPDLYQLLNNHDFEVDLFADCPVNTSGFKDSAVLFLKRTAVKYHLMPSTMKSKEKLKRIFFGRLKSLPPEITDEVGGYVRPLKIVHNAPHSGHKVLFAVGYKKKN